MTDTSRTIFLSRENDRLKKAVDRQMTYIAELEAKLGVAIDEIIALKVEISEYEYEEGLRQARELSEQEPDK